MKIKVKVNGKAKEVNTRNLFTYRAYKIYAELKDLNLEECNCSDDNMKLVPDENTAFLIWNLPAVKTCPYATEHCKKFCYAKKAENAYPDCLPCRERNFELAKKTDEFKHRMLYTILKKRFYSRKKWLIVRIHESGDFFNQAYADAWLWIAMQCAGEYIKFICYTKSFPYFDGKKLPGNFFLRASIWDDTKPEHLETIRKNNWSTYTAVEKFQKGDTFSRCRCEDCAGCGHCWSKRKDIRCEIH